MSEYIKTKFGIWLRGLLGAIIAGGAHSITAVVVAPETFNLHGGLTKLLQLGVGGGFISGAFYLQKSPLPEMETEHRSLTEGNPASPESSAAASEGGQQTK